MAHPTFSTKGKTWTIGECWSLRLKRLGMIINVSAIQDGLTITNIKCVIHLALLFWNPLADDNDALRLAVKLHLTVYQWTHEVCVCNLDGSINESDEDSDDRLGATRRAIVRAAAAIGEAMS